MTDTKQSTKPKSNPQSAKSEYFNVLANNPRAWNRKAKETITKLSERGVKV